MGLLVNKRFKMKILTVEQIRSAFENAGSCTPGRTVLMASRVAARAAIRRLGCVGSRHRSSGPSLPTPATYGTPASAGTPEAAAVAAAAERVAVGDVATSLVKHGFAVVDGALDGVLGETRDDAQSADRETTTLAERLRDELLRLASSPGVMRPNATVLVRPDGTRARLEKGHIFEAEMHALSASEALAAPALRAVAEDRSLLTLLNVMLPSVAQTQLHHQVVKLQRNAGFGGCFPLHFDSDARVDGRRVTVLTYLNPDWRDGDGGELILYPFPLRAPVKIEPKMGRVVLFSAANMLHSVEPSVGPRDRLCFTQWFFARNGDASRASPSVTKCAETAVNDDDDAWAQARALCRPELRRHLAKAVFAETWEASIRNAHPPSAARADALETHAREAATIARALAGRYPEGVRLVARVAESGTEQEKERLGVTWL
jgi:hypothetical protein